jgi:hypothetical protein
MQAGGGLFDIRSDPGERRDVKGQHPEVAAKLDTAMQHWIKETNPRSPRDKETRPITLAHPAAEYTQLPARDAEADGGVVRSNKFPNCTFMTNWTSTDDRITWNVEVLDQGDFAVEMFYACAQQSVGAEIELRLGDQRIGATIEAANDVPPKGMEHDRFPRVEGYVKDWRPMKLGVIHLPPGRARLALQATKVPGEKVADMRLLMFRRVKTAR